MNKYICYLLVGCPLDQTLKLPNILENPECMGCKEIKPKRKFDKQMRWAKIEEREREYECE